jgi:hypothetical protein
MVALPRGKLEHSGDIVRLEIGVIGENLCAIRASRQEIQHILHTNAHATESPTGRIVIARRVQFRTAVARRPEQNRIRR